MYFIYMSLKRVLTFSFLLVTAFSVFSQSEQVYPRGAILNAEAYNSLPRRAPSAIRDYEGLPRSASLKQFAPLPGDQTDYGTCVAWASAYAARTISESVALNRMSQSETTQNVFSPVFIYRNIRPNDIECLQGAQIFWALDMMKETGAVKMLDIERSTDFKRVDVSLYQNSRKYPISGYVTLFSKDDRFKTGLIARTVKKSITEGRPVIIGMNTPDSFYTAKDVWRPTDSPEAYYGGHAMCVVGYDDDKYGGAFEILNSWGRKWGNGGFIWVPYNIFVDFVQEGYEIIENLSIYSDTLKFNGFVQFEFSGQDSHEPIPLVFTEDGYYITAETLKGGTELRFAVGARESAYVYTFTVSKSSHNNTYFSPVLMFPQAGVSPLLNFSDSIVVLPGGNKSFVLDTDAGIEFLITLYSKQPLDIQTVMRRFSYAKGSFNERLLRAVGDNILTTLAYSEKEPAFTAEPDDSRSIAVLVIAIEHE